MRITFLQSCGSTEEGRRAWEIVEQVTLGFDDVESVLALPDQLPDAHAELGVLIATTCDPEVFETTARYVESVRARGAHIGFAVFTNEDNPAAVSRRFRGVDDLVLRVHLPLATDRTSQFLAIQNQLRRARATQVFLNTTRDGYWVWDLAADRIDWSERTRTLTRLAEEDVPKTMAEFMDLIHPNDRDAVSEAVERHLNDHVPYRSVPFRIRGSAGGYREFVANGAAVRDGDGTPTVMVGAITDMTTQHQVERQLEESRQRYAVLFHYMNDAAVLADPETGLIVEVNEPAERLWKRDHADLVGAHQTSLHPPALTADARKAFEDHIAELVRDNRASITVPIITSTGLEIPTEISSSLVELDGRTMILGVFRDITERVQSETALRERDAQLQLASRLAAMGSLAAGVGHEINNPLTYVLGNLTYIASELESTGSVDPDVLAAISEAVDGAKRVRDIVQDLKAITRSDDSEQVCDPGDVVRIATRIAMSDIRHRADVVLEINPTGRAAVSGSRLTQVLLNVLTNASHSFSSARAETNRIVVKVETKGPHVEIRCEDNGSGIPPEDLGSVFEPFFTTKDSGEGTGLGLSICRRILSEVGGSIRLESELGVGTSAIVEVPRLDEDVAEDEEAGAVSQTTVLIIDDDEFICRALQRMLRKDFDVTVRGDSRVATEELIAGHDYDVILCDLMMPKFCGEDVYLALTEARPEMASRMLFVTGGAVTPGCSRFEAEMRAADRVLIKPVVASELIERVHALADGGGDAATSES